MYHKIIIIRLHGRILTKTVKSFIRINGDNLFLLTFLRYVKILVIFSNFKQKIKKFFIFYAVPREFMDFGAEIFAQNIKIFKNKNKFINDERC